MSNSSSLLNNRYYNRAQFNRLQVNALKVGDLSDSDALKPSEYLSTYNGIVQDGLRLGVTNKNGYEVISYDLKLVIDDMQVREFNSGTSVKMLMKSKKPNLSEIKLDGQNYNISYIKVNNEIVSYTQFKVAPDTDLTPHIEIYNPNLFYPGPNPFGYPDDPYWHYPNPAAPPDNGPDTEFSELIDELNYHIVFSLPTPLNNDELFEVEVGYDGPYIQPFNDVLNFSNFWSISEEDNSNIGLIPLANNTNVLATTSYAGVGYTFLVFGGESALRTQANCNGYPSGVANFMMPCNLDVSNMAQFTTTLEIPKEYFAISSSTIASCKSISDNKNEYVFNKTIPIPITYFGLAIMDKTNFHGYNYKEVTLHSKKKIKNCSAWPLPFTPDATDALAETIATGFGYPAGSGVLLAPTIAPITEELIEFVDYVQIVVINWLEENLNMEYPFDKIGSRFCQSTAIANELVGTINYGSLGILLNAVNFDTFSTALGGGLTSPPLPYSVPGIFYTSSASPEATVEQRSLILHEVVHQFFGDHVGIIDRTDLFLKEGIGVFIAWYLEVILDIKNQYGAGSAFHNRYDMNNVGRYYQKSAAAYPSILKSGTYNTEAAAGMFWALILGTGVGPSPPLATPLTGATVDDRFKQLIAGFEKYIKTYPNTTGSIDDFIEAVAFGSGTPFTSLRYFVYDYLSYGRTAYDTPDSDVLPSKYIIDSGALPDLEPITGPLPLQTIPPFEFNPLYPVEWVDLQDTDGCRNLA